jgi:glycosyltransferase involved in cell wall biosynthesis
VLGLNTCDQPEPAAATMSAVLKDYPGVSVVMPILNEEKHLAAAVGQILAQDYPGDLQVILSIGPSKDRTHDIADQLAAGDERVEVVDNPSGRTPSGLNLGIAAARYEIIARVDGHGELTDGYIKRAVELLVETGAANVGGVMDAQGVTPFEQAVAYAYTSRLGMGGSKFHLEESPAGPAETVYLGVFDKSKLLEAGGFDESMHRAQDWELNHRLVSRGELIWFSPELKVTYRPRSSLSALASQFYRTGKWRREVVRRYPDTAGLRYLAPPVTVSAIGVGMVGGLLGLILDKTLLKLGWLAPLGYLLLIIAGTLTAGDLDPRARARLPLVLAVMHIAWGLGFIVGLGDHPSRDK